MNLENKNVFVSGVGKGIGFEIVNKIISLGGNVYAITRSKSDLIKFKNSKAKIFIGDVRNKKIINKILKKSLQDNKPINCVINNAGIRFRKNFTKISSKDLQKVFDINFFSVFYICQVFIKHFLMNKISGNILNVSSIVSDLGFSELSLYGSTKSAINNLTKSLASEYSKNNIRINAIKPGFTKTSFFKKFKNEKKKLYKWTIERTPMRKWGEAEEVADLVVFLISDKSKYLNGETINIDGGWSNT